MLKKLQEEKRSKLEQMAKMAEALKERSFTAEEETQYAALSTEVEGFVKRIDQLTRLGELSAPQRDGDSSIGRSQFEPQRQTAVDPSPELREIDRGNTVNAWFRSQTGFGVTPEQVESCKRMGFNPSDRQYPIYLGDTRTHRRYQRAFREGRAMSGLQGSSGGYLTTPAELIGTLEEALLQYGGVSQVAEIIRTTQGNQLLFPTSNDTTNKGYIVGENAVVTSSQPNPTIGQVSIGAYTYSSDMILIPRSLIEDAAFDVQSYVGRLLGERIGRISNDHFTTGTGAGQPKGVVTAATLGATGASATAILTTELDSLLHSVDPAYRQASSFMMHDNFALYLRQMRDGEGRYMWPGDMTMGLPGLLLGRPWVINQSMASSVAASAKGILFGDFSKYKIRQVRQVVLMRSEERYMEYDQVAFVALLRQDGNLIDAGTHPVKYLQQHS